MVSDSTGVMSTGVVSTGVVSSGVVSTGVVSAGVFSGLVSGVASRVVSRVVPGVSTGPVGVQFVQVSPEHPSDIVVDVIEDSRTSSSFRVVIFVVSVTGMVFETEVLMKLEDSLVDTLLELVDPEVTEVVETEEVSREVPEDEV